ncbi:hypothetical protein MKW98_009319 [Papaver atlanticum]|uniref:Uncharacterized protein n=1 Tax=Papaver atlanticum TaxID=357466 RepID=A0AAD4RZI1_9MAGN|nr:hypothetical protein MKW98_009319 [Papaver atlanticum]
MLIDQPSLASFLFCSSSISIYLTICLILSCSVIFSPYDCFIFTGTDVGEGRDLLSILSHFGNLTDHRTNFHQICEPIHALKIYPFQLGTERKFTHICDFYNALAILHVLFFQEIVDSKISKYQVKQNNIWAHCRHS